MGTGRAHIKSRCLAGTRGYTSAKISWYIDGSTEKLNLESCPIGTLIEGKQGDIIPLEIVIRSQPHNMREKETVHTAQLETLFGYTQRPDYCRCGARRIYTCGISRCGMLLNPNSLGRGIRGH